MNLIRRIFIGKTASDNFPTPIIKIYHAFIWQINCFSPKHVNCFNSRGWKFRRQVLFGDWRYWPIDWKMPILTIIRVGHFCRSRNQKPPRLSLLNSRIDLNNPSKCSLCTILFNELLDIMLIKFDLHSILTFTSQSKQFYEVRTILRTQTTFLLYQKLRIIESKFRNQRNITSLEQF